jgi:hypothetical protein
MVPAYSITSSARSRNASEIFRPDDLGGRQIDDQVESGRLLDWNVSWFRSTQNLVNYFASAPKASRFLAFTYGAKIPNPAHAAAARRAARRIRV